MRKFDLEERLLEYAVKTLAMVNSLPKDRVGNHIAEQLLKAGTSPYANHAEAQAAESLKDFIHKMRICLKELRESSRWLKLIQRANLSKAPELVHTLLIETDELIRIFVASIRTAETNRAIGATHRASGKA